MTQSRRVYGFFALTIGTATALLSGCASSRPQSFATSFLPSTPIPAPVSLPIEKPLIVQQRFYAREMPNLAPPPPSEIERRLTKSEERFESGKRAYQAGDAALARTEFDRALDVLLSAPDDLADRHRLERRVQELVDMIYRYDLDRLGARESKQAVVYDKSPIDSMLDLTFPIDPKLKPKVKEEIQATLSQLPLEQNDTVLSYLNYFTSERGRRVLLYGLRRAGRYRPLIQRILDEEGVPQELLFLAQAESAFLPRAVSNKQATGMWQFMDYTGRTYGLEATSTSDARLDPEKATRAAARHLRDLYATFGDWYLAMAAYNCGVTCVDRAVQRTGYADFWELSARNALPKQTMNYVPLILALTIMTKNPKDYGLDHIEVDQPLEYDTLAVTSPTSLDLIADAADMPVSELSELNPALLQHIAPAGYQVHVPKGTASSVIAALEPIPEIHRASWRMHRVQAGDTLASIGKRFNTPAEAVAGANNRTLSAPEAGDLLVIPISEPERRSARKNRGQAETARVSASVLQRRASARTIKTASVNRTHHAR